MSHHIDPEDEEEDYYLDDSLELQDYEEE